MILMRRVALASRSRTAGPAHSGPTTSREWRAADSGSTRRARSDSKSRQASVTAPGSAVTTAKSQVS